MEVAEIEGAAALRASIGPFEVYVNGVRQQEGADFAAEATSSSSPSS